MGLKSCRLFFLLFMLNMLLVACSTPAELEGTWIGYEMGDPHRDWTLSIQRNQFTLVREDSGMWYTGHLELNNNCVLNKMDLEISDMPFQMYIGKTWLGIYQVEEDVLTLVAGEPGDDVRPWSFNETRDTVAFVFEKSKED
jgi:uncharacterized protein (TIGR03067 family)